MPRRLRIGIARDNFIDLPTWSAGWCKDESSYYAAVATAGYEAVQGGESEPCTVAGLNLLGNGVVPTPEAAQDFAEHWKGRGALAATCIAGFGYESDGQSDEIARAIVRASKETGLPIYLETHRASITQDAWRTLRLAERSPDLRFNGDFSHWVTGQEMAYGDFDRRLELLEPIFARTNFLHGRVGDRCCMQVKIESENSKLLEPFERMWTSVMRAFKSGANDSATLWFCTELLGTGYQYARVIDGREETDRWEQAAILVRVAKQCAASAGLPHPEGCQDG